MPTAHTERGGWDLSHHAWSWSVVRRCVFGGPQCAACSFYWPVAAEAAFWSPACSPAECVRLEPRSSPPGYEPLTTLISISMSCCPASSGVGPRPGRVLVQGCVFHCSRYFFKRTPTPPHKMPWHSVCCSSSGCLHLNKKQEIRHSDMHPSIQPLILQSLILAQDKVLQICVSIRPWKPKSNPCVLYYYSDIGSLNQVIFFDYEARYRYMVKCYVKFFFYGCIKIKTWLHIHKFNIRWDSECIFTSSIFHLLFCG